MNNRRAPLIVGIVAGFLALLLIFFLVLPKFSEVGQAKEDLAAEQERENQLRTQLEQLQEAKAQARDAQKELNRLEREVPPTDDIESLILLLNNISIESNVDWMSVTPGAPTAVPGAQFSIIPTQVVVTGGFFAVDEFLFRLETLPRQMKVINLTVAAGPDGLPQLQISMSAEAYTTDTSAGPGSIPGPTDPQAVPTEAPTEG
jgi:Tfp pilus assembly protein PilO